MGDLANLVASLEINGDILTVDLNGDGILEIVLNLAVAANMNEPRDHATWVLQCRVGQYHVIHAIHWGWWHFYDYTFFDDINGDGNSEVLIIGGFAGSACGLEPTVLGWENGKIVDYSPDYMELELGCSPEDHVKLEDLDNDGFKELIVSGYTMGHNDMAPERGITQTFALQDSSYKLQTTDFAPAEFRIHVLDDAQRAFDEGNLILAAQLYEQAASDDTLGNVYSKNYAPLQMAEEMGWTERDYPGEYQRAFAFFRLAALQALSGDEVGVSSTLTQLQQTFPEGTPGREFVVLTPILATSLLQGTAPELACAQVFAYIEANFPDLESHYYWGGNIAWYQNETICPFTAP